MEPCSYFLPSETKLILNEVASCTAQLYNIKQLTPATYVHRNRDGNFINTAKGYYGAQTITNFCKGHDTVDLANAISNFADQFFKSFLKCLDSTFLPAATFLHEHALKALGTKESGLLAVEETYQGDQGVINAIEYLRSNICLLGQRLVQSKNLPYADDDYGTMEYLLEQHSRKLSSEQVGITKYTVNYAASFYYNFCRCLTGMWNWQDKIGDFHQGSIYLGILPFRSTIYDSLEYMKNEGITVVMSITEVYENNSGTFQAAIKPSEYKEENIDHFQMPAIDFKTLPISDLESTIEYMENKLQNGHRVYVHCKAGRGRSAEVTLAYLIRYHNMTVNQALLFVQSKRTQVSLGQARMATLEKIADKYQKKDFSISAEFEFL